MKQTKLMVMAMMAVALMATSCASKKDLQNCQNENKELSSNYQATKEKLAATEASLAAAQEQLATAKSDYAKLQNSLDKSLNNASQNNVSIEKLVDQINESNQYIRHLVEVKSKSDSLNMVLTNNLTRSLSKEELKAAGLNDSNTHVDFMVGTADLSIIGTTKDGREIPVFVNGNFAL
mgnify:CR=1 FL=1